MRKEILVNNNPLTYSVDETNETTIVQIDGVDYCFQNIFMDDNKLHFKFMGEVLRVPLSVTGGEIHCDVNGRSFHVKKIEKSFSKSAASDGEGLISPMPGKIIKVCQAVGDMVEKGQAIIVMEAMKMEHTLSAHKDGIISAINAKEGELVEGGISLAELREVDDSK
jgi:3-methylcrotonyl-CoA carboxylase alpha subunit